MDQSEDDIIPFRAPRLNKDQGDIVLSTNNQVCTCSMASTRKSFESTRSVSSYDHNAMHNQSVCHSAGRITESIPDKVKENPSINKDSSFFGCGRSLQSLIDQGAGVKSPKDVNPMPMNIRGSISSTC